MARATTFSPLTEPRVTCTGMAFTADTANGTTGVTLVLLTSMAINGRKAGRTLALAFCTPTTLCVVGPRFAHFCHLLCAGICGGTGRSRAAACCGSALPGGTFVRVLRRQLHHRRLGLADQVQPKNEAARVRISVRVSDWPRTVVLEYRSPFPIKPPASRANHKRCTEPEW